MSEVGELDLDATRTIDAVIARRADVAPEAPALLAPGRATTTFGNLHGDTEVLRGALQQWGLGHTDVVALGTTVGAVPAAFNLVVSAAAIAAPMQPGWAVEEAADHLALVGARAVLVDPGPSAPREAAARRGIDAIEVIATGRAGGFEIAEPADRRPATPWQESRPDDLTLVVTSAGSSGRPVVVPRSHAQMLRATEALVDALALDENDRCLSLTPMFRTIALAGLCSGGATILPDAFDGTAVRRWFVDLSPTWITTGPVVLTQLLALLRRQRDLAALAPLRFVLSSGARLPTDVQDELEDRLGIPILGSYGSVETYRIACERPVPGGHRRGTVGQALGCEVRVVDDHETAVASGVEGEVVVRGPSVAEGYLGDPAATAARFRDGWFHTRDLGVMDGDGFLTLTGRADERINRGGEMISPQQVEEVVARHPAVTAAMCFALPHPTLGEELAVAVIPVGDGHVRADEIRAHVARHLGATKVPRAVFEVDEFGTSVAEKLQRRALAERLAWAAPGGPDIPRSAPSTETGRRLAALWERVLPSAAPPADGDDFFDVGGHSLAALELISQIALAFGVEPAPGELLASPTLADMAALIDRDTAADATGGVGARVAAGHASTLISLRDGHGDSVAMIPGVSGALLSQERVARLMISPNPIIGLEAPGLRAGERAAVSVEALARHHDRLIERSGTSVRVLVGASFGGLVAAVLAQRRARSGHRVSLVIMLDTTGPRHVRHAARAARRQRGVVRAGWRTARDWSDWLLAPHRSATIDDRIARVLRIHRRTAVRSPLPRLVVPTVLVTTDESRRRVADPTLGWREHCDQLTVIHVGGDHRSVLRDEAETTAAIIDALVAGDPPAVVAQHFCRPATYD